MISIAQGSFPFRLLKSATTLFVGLSALVGASVNFAHAAPGNFVYEGVLQDTNGPVTTASTLILRIYDPGLSCLLYEEMQTVTPEATGSFSVRVGSALGDAKRTSNDPGLPLSSIFAPSGVVRSPGSSYCTTGYTATASDSRRLVLNVNGTDLSPSVEISSAPFAVSASAAEKVGSYAPSMLLRSDGSTAVAPLNDAKVSVLMNLVSGTLGTPSGPGEAASKSYVDTVASGLLPLGTAFGGDVSGTYNALTVGKINGRSVDETGIAAGKILKFDGTKWTMGDDTAGSGGLSAVSGVAPLTASKIWVGNASNVATEVSMSGDATLASNGTLTLSNTLGSGGTVGSAQSVPQLTYDAKGRLTAATAVTIDDTTKLPKSGGTMTGALSMGGQDITTAGHITMDPNKYLTLSANATNGTAAGQMWYDSGVIKYHDGTSVKSLGVAGAGITNFNGATVATQTLAVPGTSGTAPNWSTDTATGIHTLNIPLTSFAAKGLVQFQTDAATSGVNVTSGVATVMRTTTGQSSTILSLDGTGVANMYGAGLKGATSGTITLKSAAAATNYSLTLPATQGGANQVLANDGLGNLAWASALTAISSTASLTSNLIWVGNASNKAVETTPSSLLIMKGGQSGATSLGTTDATDLSFLTGNVAVMTVKSGGNVGVGTTAPGRLLHVNGPMRVQPAILPTTPAAGDIAIDSGAANALKYHNGTSWISLAGGTGDFMKDGTVAMTGQFKALSGTVTAPGISFSADVNTGFVNPAAENIGFVTNGIERMRVDGNGNVGIGISAPLDMLSLYKANAGLGINIISDNTSTTTARYPYLNVTNYMGAPATKAGGNPGINLINMRGTYSNSSAMQAGEALGSITFGGSNGNTGNYNEGAAIWGVTSQSFTPGAGGTSMSFYTTPNGSTASQIRFWIDQSGNVGVGTNAPAYTLQVAGVIAPIGDGINDLGAATNRFNNVYAANGVIQTSDAREKKDIQDSDLGLDFINRLRAVSYHWKHGDSHLHYGVIAQEMEQAMIEAKKLAGRPEEVDQAIVSQDSKSGAYGVRYTELIAPLIKAVQDLNNKLVDIESALSKQSRELAAEKQHVLELELENARLKNARLKSESENVKAWICSKDPGAVLCH